MSMHWPVISSDTDTGLKVVRTSRFCPLILITGSFIYPTDSPGSYYGPVCPAKIYAPGPPLTIYSPSTNSNRSYCGPVCTVNGLYPFIYTTDSIRSNNGQDCAVTRPDPLIYTTDSICSNCGQVCTINGPGPFIYVNRHGPFLLRTILHIQRTMSVKNYLRTWSAVNEVR